MAYAEPLRVRLPAVRTSPTTLQYLTKGTSPHSRPAYRKKFYPSPAAQATLSLPWLAQTDPLMPPYPHGRNMHFDEANHGLYGGATLQSGNKIATGRNKGKTLRKWYPNVRVEKLQSQALGVTMSIPTTARTMRTIRKCGGLDEYLTGEKPARIKELGLLGWKLRWLVLKSRSVQTGAGDAYALDATFEQAWRSPRFREEVLAKMGQNWKGLREKQERWHRHVKETLRWDGEVEERATEKVVSLEYHEPEALGLENLEVEEEKPLRQIVVPRDEAVAVAVEEAVVEVEETAGESVVLKSEQVVEAKVGEDEVLVARETKTQPEKVQS